MEAGESSRHNNGSGRDEVPSEDHSLYYDRVSRDELFDEGGPRYGPGSVEPSAITFTRHDFGVGAGISSAPGRSPLRRKPGGPRYSGVRRGDVPLVTALRVLDEAATGLGLPPAARETAAMLLQAYYRWVERRPGRPEPLVAAAILKAAEIHNVALPQGEVEEALGLRQGELWKARAKLMESPLARQIARRALSRGGPDRLLARAKSHIVAVTGRLGLPPEVAQLASKVLEGSMRAERAPGQKKDLHGKKPEAVAAASVYLAARLLGYEITQKQVADAARIKESNVRKHYRFLIDNIVVLVYM